MPTLPTVSRLAAALLVVAAPLAAVGPDDAGSSLASSSLSSIIEAIGELESKSDAKCQATAERLENFMYGTPLTEDARFERNRLQKELVQRLWRAASDAARAAGEATVTAARLAPLVAGAMRSETGGDGTVTVAAAGEKPLVLTPTDVRQYSSVAYSLRAILAVQQDDLLAPGGLVAADRGALDALRAFLDRRTLATLQLADRRARAADRRAVDAEAFRAAWHALAPVPAETPVRRPAAAAVPGLPVLRAIIDEKIAAYTAYNRIEQEESEKLFRRNVSRFYARYALPPSLRGRRLVEQAFVAEMVAFAERVLGRAQELARADGEPVVRAPHVARAVQEASPHQVDDLEDVVYFYRLPEAARVRLESYDMDSFRDFGMHWKLLGVALGSGTPAGGTPDFLALDLDPFAAEGVAEGIAQYGVLLFRIAGNLAREQGEWPFVTPAHVRWSGEALQVVARQHHATPPPPATQQALASAAETTTPRGTGAHFRDATAEAGLAYEHRSSDWLSRLRRTLKVLPPTFSGGGIAAEDVDGDGHVDLLLVGGMGNALYFNDGQGGFEDWTERAGLGFERADGYPGEARQPIVADFDNDGRQDVLVTYVNDDHRLYRNLGERRFADVSAASGLGGAGLVGGPATVFDFDGDGLLDVYLGYFGDYLAGAVPEDNSWGFEPDERAENLAAGEYLGDVPTLSRDNQNALPNRLFKNLGGLRFADVTAGSGADDTGWAQAVSHTDLDGDGRQDLVVANDFGRNAWLMNRGGGRFEDVSDALGMTEAYHSMNVGVADLNRDDRPDVYISNINTMVKDDRYVLPSEETKVRLDPASLATMRIVETSVLYASLAGPAPSFETSEAVGRGETSVGWAWDADFFDFDNDGDDDLYVVNGTNEYRMFDKMWLEGQGDKVKVYHLSHDRESNVLYVNRDGRLQNLSPGSGADLVSNARSAVYLDYDRDGDLDVAINNFHSPATFLESGAESLGHHWLFVRLVGDPAQGSNRDAIGARLVATTAAGRRVWREVHGGSGYLSMEPKLQHLGLGPETSADLKVTWPNGEVQTFAAVAANRTYEIVQGGKPRVVDLP